MSTYPTYKLGEIIDKVSIEFKVKQKEYLPKGKFPVVDQGQDLIGGFVDDESLLVKTELPVIVFGDHTKAKKFIDFPFVAGADGTKIIKPKKEFFIEPKLFYWFLHCVKFPDKGYARHFQYLLKSDIAIPPLATQHAIVTRIETLFAELDKAVQHLRTAQQQLKTYRQAVLNHWLNNEDGKWETVKLGEVADAIDPEPSHRTPKIQKDGIPFVSIKDCDYITNTINLKTARLVSKDILTEHKERYSIKEGDFIIGKIGTIGNPVNVILPQEYALSANVVLIQPTDKINANFLYNAFRSNIVEKQLFDGKKATTQAAFGIKKVRLIEIPLPPLAEQQRIVNEIESRLSQATASETYIENAQQQAEALRQSILKKAFSGELV